MEPLNSEYDERIAAQAIADALMSFYKKLTNKLDSVDIYKVVNYSDTSNRASSSIAASFFLCFQTVGNTF